jgi:hypothetical protein
LVKPDAAVVAEGAAVVGLGVAAVTVTPVGAVDGVLLVATPPAVTVTVVEGAVVVVLVDWDVVDDTAEVLVAGVALAVEVLATGVALVVAEEPAEKVRSTQYWLACHERVGKALLDP